MLHEDVETVIGRGLYRYTQEPILENGKLIYRDGPTESRNKNVIASIEKPFNTQGGLKVMSGNIGRAIMKVSAVDEQHQIIVAPAVVFNDQHELEQRVKSGELNKNFVAVVRFQGPKAIGMPELYKLITPLGILQDRGFHVALLTDGRLSGASGKVPSVIHVTPEAYNGGILSKINDGDIIMINGKTGEMNVQLDEETLQKRQSLTINLNEHRQGFGRELFNTIRKNITSAEEGADSF